MNKNRLEQAYEQIHQKFDKITPTGRLSKVKSRNLISYVNFSITFGLEEIKKHGSEKTFKKYMQDLKKCGITKEFILEEFEKNKFKKNTKKIEFIEMKLDFNNQLPSDFIEPKSKYSLEEILGKK